MSTKAQHPHHDGENFDGEDNGSLASSSARTNKFKVTVPVAPKFICGERLERRKEYYAKLEEKHKGLERERLEAEARKKEQEDAEIKELRKSMVYRANPVPSFYREGPPPKQPLTRPKSPKLTRRRSCGDAGRTCCGEMGNERGSHRSGACRGKERNGGRRSVDTIISKDEDEDEDEGE